MAEVREIDLIAREMTYIESWMAAFSAFERCEAACSSENKGPYFLGAEPLTIPMVRTGRGSTVKERGGATHYSYGEDR